MGKVQGMEALRWEKPREVPVTPYHTSGPAWSLAWGKPAPPWDILTPSLPFSPTGSPFGP